MRLEHWLFTIPLRLRSLFCRGQADQELEDELRDHLERQTEENISHGMSREEARRRALLAMGRVEAKRSAVINGGYDGLKISCKISALAFECWFGVRCLH